MRLTSTDPVRHALDDADFPADKEQLAEHARRRGAPTEVRRALAALPLGRYGNLVEVLRSVPTDPAPERSPAERASQQRHHRHSGLAEHLREAERPPVEEALREDR